MAKVHTPTSPTSVTFQWWVRIYNDIDIKISWLRRIFIFFVALFARTATDASPMFEMFVVCEFLSPPDINADIESTKSHPNGSGITETFNASHKMADGQSL